MNFDASANTALQCGVPQASVLWPFLFIIYTAQLGQTTDGHQIPKQHFADDTQLESPFDPDENSVKAAIKNLEHCCGDIKTWMMENRLKLDYDKTEVLLCRSSSLQRTAPIDHNIQVCESQISLSASARDLGLVNDADVDMTAHTSSVIKSCYCHLRSLGKLLPFLTQDAANAIAVSLIMSRLV